MFLRLIILLPILLLGCTDKSDIVDTGAVVTTSEDTDGDGFTAEDGDCDDSNASVSPGAAELCDGVDNNCDGTIDEGVTTTAYVDTDGDGFGDDDVQTDLCEISDGYAPIGGDCDDSDATAYPGATEICDEVDNNCDGDIDEGLGETFYADTDGDGYGDADAALTGCEAPDGYVSDATDCDDSSDLFHPGAAEKDCTDKSDYNCDGSVGYADADADGYAACEECDDRDEAINPDASEVCDSIDNDCDALTDDADDSLDTTTQSTWYTDADSDGYGDAAASTAACDAPSGTVADDTDCDDTASTVNPGADEECNDIDDDCDTLIDDDDDSLDTSTASTFYADDDGDGYGDAAASTVACDAPSGTVTDSTDCDDTDSDINPAATEVCDGDDNDCDGDTDDNDSSLDTSTQTTFYADSDSDGYGDASDSTAACDAPSGTVADDTDCDDTDSAVNPDATEVCNGTDDDCDGDTDDNDSSLDTTTQSTWYTDADSDGFGDTSDSTVACDAPSGTVADGTDCDDDDSAVNPDASEVCNDIDDDCDGATDDDDSSLDTTTQTTWYTDGDGDGFGDASNSTDSCAQPGNHVEDGTDCDDRDTDINPDASEVCDGIDNDCDGDIDDDDSSLDTTTQTTSYADDDGDGYGDADNAVDACELPSGHVPNDVDCDDADSAVNPGADEVCNDIDDDCDTLIDNDDPSLDTSTQTLWYADADSDGFGSASNPAVSCDQPSGYVEDATDCDDRDATINPDAAEVCDSIDNDCDDLIDDDDTLNPSAGSPFYADTDADGYGDVGSSLTACEQPSGYVEDATDCDDTDDSVYPGATELCDGLDSDCDGSAADADLASFESSDGDWTDLTDTFAAGTASSPISWTLSDDGTLWLCEGTWYAEVDVTATDAAIEGLHGAEVTTLSGSDSVTPISTESTGTLDITGLTITDGYSTACGGGIYAADTTVTLTELDITGNEAITGGGLCVDGGTVSVSAISVTDNLSDGNGAGVWLDMVTSANLSDLTISGNLSTASGGGLYADDCTITLSDAAITANNSIDYGAGLYFGNSDVTISAVTISDNLSDEGKGAGIALRSSSTLALSASTIEDNTSDDDGGGIFLKESSMELSDVTISGNTSGDKGGGMYLDDGVVSIELALIESNESDDDGGGVYFKNLTLTVTDTTITGNTSADKGGGVYLEGENASFDSVAVEENAGNEGGGLFIKDADVSLESCSVSDNLSDDDGGGMTIDEDGDVDVTTSDWVDNDPDDVYLKESETTYSYGTSETFSCTDQSCS